MRCLSRTGFARTRQGGAAALTHPARALNIHEYAAKDLLKKHGCSTEVGYVASTLAEAEAAIKKIDTPRVVVKAQILAGGRGKGTFVDGFKGGVHVCDGAAAALDTAKRMLGNRLLTKQTGPRGQQVNKLYITETVEVAKEVYVALTLDRATCCPTFIGCAEGGMGIEEVAASNPAAIQRLPIQVFDGLKRSECAEFTRRLGFTDAKKAALQLEGIYNLAKQKDCTMVEINPMVELKNGEVMCIDAKVALDDNAAFRHTALWERLEDFSQEDPRDVAAHKADLTFVALDGNVGCIVNGAGLAMATMDMISNFGCSAANFLDTGGNATGQQIKAALEIISGDKAVKCILLNIFGGITHCDLIAQGIIDGVKLLGKSFTVPIVVRLQGTHDARGLALIEEAQKSGLNLLAGSSFEDACSRMQQIVQAQ